MRLLALARLGYWLGPWAGSERAPAGISREQLSAPPRAAGERPIPVSLFRPRAKARGSIFIVPGLHFLGPRDPRLDRFARVLAHAGFDVAAPLLPDFADMRVVPSLLPDTERAFEHFLRSTSHSSAGVMSISFGSLPALALASESPHRTRVRRLVIFGGFFDFIAALHFCLSGDGRAPHDPLNRPALFLNLLPVIHNGSGDAALRAAWMSYMRQTWGRPEMKVRAAHEPLALRLSETVPEPVRELFLQGCGVAPGGIELAREAIDKSRDSFDWLDPRSRLHRLQCKLDVVHGRDDDVIPSEHAHLLANAAPARARCQTHITGMYGHDGGTGPTALARRLPQLASELGTMLSVLNVFSRLGGD